MVVDLCNQRGHWLDLYGNDENEFAVPTTELPEQPSAKETQEHFKEEEQGSILESFQEPLPSVTTTKLEQEDVKPYAALPSAAPPTSTIPSYMSSPDVQQIPTYEERQPSDLREPPPPRLDAGYPGVPGVDRPVRPSEMKEEG